MKTLYSRNDRYPRDNPVDEVRKDLPKGNGDWPGFDSVYTRLQRAAEHLAKGTYTHLGADHVTTMAIMGCGDEETMKGWLHVCLVNHWTE